MKMSKLVNNQLVGIVSLVIWGCGLVIAKGFWWTFFAFVFLPYDVYLVAKLFLTHFGMI